MDLKNVKSYLGIDLAGYAANRTAVVKLEIEDSRAIFKILRNHPFNRFDSSKPFQNQIREEVEFLYVAYHNWLSHIVIDAPIDLSQLSVDLRSLNRSCDRPFIRSKTYDPEIPKSGLNSNNLNHCWQLQKRPIDRALGGMPPVHSNLGIVTKRAELALAKSFASESYPKISKRLIGYREDNIDNKLFELKEFLQHKNVSLSSAVLNLTKDELDAIFCALAGMSDADAIANEHKQALKNINYSKLSKKSLVEWPKNYRILIDWPKKIKSVLISDFVSTS